MSRISFVGQAAVVTGAGGGIGRAHALELARRGASVIVNDVMREPGPSGPGTDAVVREIEEAGGIAAASNDSVATQDGGEAIIAAALERFGSVDVVVHNAATWRNGPYHELSRDTLEPVLDVNLRGAFFVTRPAWPAMIERKYGRIVLTSSGVGVFGRVNGANYVAAKAGVYGLSRALALEGEEHGIRVNSLMPIASTAKNPLDRAVEDRKEPERVSPLVAYLASSACAVSGEAFTTGMGGHVARIFMGVTSGWFSGAEIPTAEEIEEHLNEIEDRTTYAVPRSHREFMSSIVERLHADTAG